MTFVDPRIEGGKVNELTKNMPDIVHLIQINSKEYLRYDIFPINVAILRGTIADERGNISLKKEGVTLENLSMAQAAKNMAALLTYHKIVKRWSFAELLPQKV